MKKLTESKEYQEEKQKLRQLKGMKKVEYIWDYYKIHILVTLVVLLFLVSYTKNILSQKDAVLYATLVNMEYDEALEEKLDTRFISDYLLGNPRKEEVDLSTTRYLSDDNLDMADTQYVVAMQTRLLANISGKMMDIVLMDESAFEGFASSGYLMDLDTLLSEQDPTLKELLQKDLKEATVVISNNQSEVLLDASIPYEEVTQVQTLGIDVSDWTFFADATLPSPIYLGIISNSPRTEEALDYIHYLLQDGSDALS